MNFPFLYSPSIIPLERGEDILEFQSTPVAFLEILGEDKVCMVKLSGDRPRPKSEDGILGCLVYGAKTLSDIYLFNQK